MKDLKIMVIKKYYLIINKPLYMSEIKTIPIPIANPIRYSKSWHSFSNPNGGLQKYFFDLTINMNSGNKKTFRKLESSKHAELIQLDDEIKYSNIKDHSRGISGSTSSSWFFPLTWSFMEPVLMKDNV